MGFGAGEGVYAVLPLYFAAMGKHNDSSRPSPQCLRAHVSSTADVRIVCFWHLILLGTQCHGTLISEDLEVSLNCAWGW